MVRRTARLVLTLLACACRRALATEAAAAPATLCQLSDERCGSAEGQCFSTGVPVQRMDRVELCLGFQSVDSPYAVQATGKKAIFSTKVDEYATLSVETRAPRRTPPSAPAPAFAAPRSGAPRVPLAVAPIMKGSNFAAKQEYQYVWVGAHDKRTVGQSFGWASDDEKTCLSEAPASKAGTKEDCVGWRLHQKPVVTRGGRLISSATAIIHVDMGVVKSIMWDSSCNLVRRRP